MTGDVYIGDCCVILVTMDTFATNINVANSIG